MKEIQGHRFWVLLVLSSLTLIVFVLLLWELVERSFFKDLDYKTLHFLYITRGVVVSLVLAVWTLWFIWREKIKYQENFARIINSSSDAILVYDESGRISALNKEAENLFCSNENQLQNMWDIIPPDRRDDFSERLKSVKEGKKLVNYETVRVQNDGRLIPVSVGLAYVRQDNGRFVETIRDIRESIILRDKIVELEKAQVIEKVAKGIAHHMGTPLASMLLRIQLLKEDILGIPECANFVEKLDSVERQISYCKKVIQGLLRFISNSGNARFPRNISVPLKNSVEIIKPLLRESRIEPELIMDKDFDVLADSDLLELVFVDIMMNAMDAMPDGGKLTVIVSKKDPGNQVEIVICDTGTGIPKEILPSVFEPFFTTKAAGRGVGLGLSVAKRIIHDHGGEIGIESVVGRGTSVRIRLPIYNEKRELV